MKHFESYKRKKKTCIECEEPIRLRDNEVQGSE